MPAHNTLLQILIDYGLIGATIFVFLILNLAALIKRNASVIYSGRERAEYDKLLNILLFYLVATSMTEASITYYSFGVLSLFFMLNLFVIFKNNEILGIQFKEKKNTVNYTSNNEAIM
jgi:O-antigen ligase